MHLFTYEFLQDILLPAEIVTLTSNITALRILSQERQSAHEEIFRGLASQARIASIKSSNAIEGLVTTDQRLHELVQGNSAPLNHTEAEIAGYRDVLQEIHTNWQLHDFSETDIHLFHSQLMHLANPQARGDYKTEDNVIAERLPDGRRVVRFAPTPAKETATDIHLFHSQLMHLANPQARGDYKTEDNVIAERLPDGRRVVRFAPTPAKETADAMQQLTLAYRIARDNPAINKLLLIPCVILDFLCVHPFSDGNGRMSRLLSLLLLYKNGFDVGRFISFENQISLNKLEYYQALQLSSQGWHENACHYLPFMLNFILTLYACYVELDKRFAFTNAQRITKTSRIEATVLNALTPLSKAEICTILPDVSPSTVEAVLGKLLRQQKIRRLGKGRGSKYLRG